MGSGRDPWRTAKGGEKRVKTRLVIPVLDEGGLDAQLSQHFGRAPYFTVIDVDKDGRVVDQETIANVSEHFGGVGRPPDRILQLRPTALITYGMGARALRIFQTARVAVLRTTATTVSEVIPSYPHDTLEELTEGCRQARHH
jgi:predicted Fe-Mo cluster-binding NifX family protein